MSILRTGTISGLGLAVRITAGLALTKLIANFLGPTGMATVAHFQNFWNIALMFSGGIFATGITREIARYAQQPAQVSAVLHTAVTLCASFAAAIGMLTVAVVSLAPTKVPSMLQPYIENSTFVAATVIALPFVAFYTVALAVLNGRGLSGWHVFLTSAQAVFLLLFSALLIFVQGRVGAMIALVITPCAMLALILVAWRRVAPNAPGNRAAITPSSFQSPVALSLLRFSLASATSAVAVPVAQIAIREYISVTYGTSEAGNWQAVNRISETYLLLISTTIALYLLPRVSKSLSTTVLWQEIRSALSFLVPVAAVLSIVVWMFQEWIVITFLSHEFLGIAPYLKWQLIGDVVRAAMWIFAYTLIGQAYLKSYAVIEISAAVLLVLFTKLLSAQGQVHHVSIAYALTNLLYLLSCVAVLVAGAKKK